MRHKGIPKEDTQRKIIDAVNRGFRKHGFAGIGIDGLAKSAGVTSGAFYSHLGSKDKAFTMALENGLDEVIEGIPKFQRENGEAWLKAFVEYYLSKSHRNDLECGCAMASLTSEVIRFDSDLHKLYETKMKSIRNLISRGLAEGSEEERNERAWSFLAVLIGGLNMARAMNSSKVTEEVSRAVSEAALKSAGKTCEVGEI